jgi:hypothetical protein
MTHLTVLDGGAHRDIMPERETVVRERDGERCSLLDHGAYPLLARCTTCGEPIRIAHYFADWEHQ